MYLDIEKMRREITMSEILCYYGVELRQSAQAHGLVGCCPIHRGDNPNAFHVNLEKNLFNCFTRCGGGSIFDFVMKKEHLSFFKAALKIWNIFYLKPPSDERKRNGRNERQEGRVKYERQPPYPYPYPHPVLSLSLQYRHPYLLKRGIDEKIARYFQMGYSSSGTMKNRIAIPIIDRYGNRVAYCWRAIGNDNDDTDSPDPGSIPKYLFPKNFSKSRHVFNIQHIVPFLSKPVFIVEGFFDCIHLVKLGFDAVALMGVVISQEQIVLLQQLERSFILMLDGDETGQEAMSKIQKQFLEAGLKYKPVYLLNGTEPENLDFLNLQIMEQGIDSIFH